jgi:hypothetical protein
MRVLRGIANQDGLGVTLTTYENPDAAPDAIDAFLHQGGNHIIVTSMLGTISFHRKDQEVVTSYMRNLADFIERNVVQ